MQLKGNKTPGGDLDFRKGGRSMAPSRSSSPPRQSELEQQPPFGAPLSRMASRRGSRVARQHSYDDDMNSASMAAAAAVGAAGGLGAAAAGALGMIGGDPGLGIPAMPRRFA